MSKGIPDENGHRMNGRLNPFRMHRHPSEIGRESRRHRWDDARPEKLC